MTLLRLMDFLPFPGKPSSWGCCGPTTGTSFHGCLARAQFNRRARWLTYFVKQRRWQGIHQLGAKQTSLYWLDTKPLPVRDYVWHAPILGDQARLNGPRERIESTCREIQDTGWHQEHLLRQTLRGLVIHVITKMTCYTLRQRLRCKEGIDVQTCTVIA